MSNCASRHQLPTRGEHSALQSSRASDHARLKPAGVLPHICLASDLFCHARPSTDGGKGFSLTLRSAEGCTRNRSLAFDLRAGVREQQAMGIAIGGRLAFALALSACTLAGCTISQTPDTTPVALPPPELPSKVKPTEIVGRWGYAAYHKPEDRARTEANARGQCKQPF